MRGLMPGIEPRIKVNVLYVAGLDLERARPEVDPLNFLPRIRIPTLMLDGRDDFLLPGGDLPGADASPAGHAAGPEAVLWWRDGAILSHAPG